MERRKLGELEVSALGLGCMGMSAFYGETDSEESTATIHRAKDLGIDFLDTAEMYGPYENEELIGRAIEGQRDDWVIATKFGIRLLGNDGGRLTREISGDPKYVREAIEGSLQRLGTDRVDLYYQHRIDPGTPIEETIGVVSQLVDEGKVLHVGLSEAHPDTIRRAHAVHPITAVQMEYSMWTRDPEDEVLPVCRELGIGFVPYSPLGRASCPGASSRPRSWTRTTSAAAAPASPARTWRRT